MEKNQPSPASPDKNDDTEGLVDQTTPALPSVESAEIEVPEPPPLPEPKPKASRQISRRESKRLAKYADLRREQYDVLNALLETLTQVDDLQNELIEQLRDAIFHADHPFLLTLVGPFSSGKSTVINALLGEKVLEAGPIPTTDHIAILRHGDSLQHSRSGSVTTVFHPSELLERVSLVDTPGLESVFEKHDELTRKFLHRADIVFLVMIATQVLTASDLAFIQALREYGKRMMIIVNQIDVLEQEDRNTVREFVRDQSRMHLGMEPVIWLVSAKQALNAQAEALRDEILWDESGFADIEEYLIETLDDEQRVLQKLETPLQVARNVISAALGHVQSAQSTLTEHRKTLDNIRAQIDASERERRKIVAATQDEVNKTWEKATQNGISAIEELFQIQRALGQSIAGMFEIIGLGAIMRRFRNKSHAEETFLRYEVRETIQEIPEITNTLGPSLEGRDQEEIDQLVEYTRQRVKQLPDTLQNKIIGSVRTPMSYNRKALRDIRSDLEDMVIQAGNFETKGIDRALRSTIILMAVWIFVSMLIAILSITGTILMANSGALNAILILVLIILGMALLPLRGIFIRFRYRNHMNDLRDRYQKVLSKAADKQIAYGTQLRQDVTAPFTRLISTQNEAVNQLKQDLERHQSDIIGLQHKLSGLIRE